MFGPNGPLMRSGDRRSILEQTEKRFQGLPTTSPSAAARIHESLLKRTWKRTWVFRFYVSFRLRSWYVIFYSLKVSLETGLYNYVVVTSANLEEDPTNTSSFKKGEVAAIIKFDKERSLSRAAISHSRESPEYFIFCKEYYLRSFFSLKMCNIVKYFIFWKEYFLRSFFSLKMCNVVKCDKEGPAQVKYNFSFWQICVLYQRNITSLFWRTCHVSS